MYYLISRYYDTASLRFINADSELHQNDIKSYNLFTYAYNSPNMFEDSNGESGLLIYLTGNLVITMIVFAVATLVVSTICNRSRRSIYSLASSLAEGSKKASDLINDAVQYAVLLSKEIAKSFKQAKRRYYKQFEVHHIVAQNDWRAQYARDILTSVRISLQASYNKIRLKKGLHKRLHRNSYYNLINSILRITSLKKKGMTNKRKRVIGALEGIKAFLNMINDASPF